MVRRRVSIQSTRSARSSPKRSPVQVPPPPRVMHANLGLIIPTVMFVVAVFGEVYTERILDAILP